MTDSRAYPSVHNFRFQQTDGAANAWLCIAHIFGNVYGTHRVDFLNNIKIVSAVHFSGFLYLHDNILLSIGGYTVHFFEIHSETVIIITVSMTFSIDFQRLCIKQARGG